MSEPSRGAAGAAIVAAALTLPGVAPPALAESAPERTVLSLGYLNYQDSQPGLKRITVNAPSLGLVVPFAGHWAIEANAVGDSVSGASPRWHSSISSASRMQDFRKAGDVRVTRYFERSSIALGTAFSSEHDYRSQAISALVRFTSDDNNTTWTYGAGRAWDVINPVNQVVVDARKNTTDLMAGVTQVLTPNDIAQVNLTWARGRGYYSDPYKVVDNRPDSRDQAAVLLRWNHFVESMQATLRTSYRYYGDSWSVRGHTFTAEWIQPLGHGWSVAPLARYHTQNAAGFYYDPFYDPVLGPPYPPGYLANPTGLYSPDARLSAFGAGTLSLKVANAIDRDTVVDATLSFYQQRSSWRIGGNGSPGIEPLTARFLQLGLTKAF